MRRRIVWLLVVLVVLLALPLANLIAGGPRGTPLTLNAGSDPVQAKVAAMLESKCAHCHVSNTPRPFYAGLPLIASLIGKDIREGLAALELGDAFVDGKTVIAEPVLAKIERELEGGDMPPLQYLLMHWQSRVSKAQRAEVATWAGKLRALHALPDQPASARGLLIRPLPRTARVDRRKAALGKKLYHDKRLSGDDTLSCASCHDLSKGGTDQEPVSDGIRKQKGGINAPTTFNAAYQSKQFWDGRAATLEEQAAGPPENPVEMGSTFPQIIQKLEKDEALTRELKEVYPGGWSKHAITDAIAAFERTLITPGARFDKYLLGDKSALSTDEKHGYDLFLAQGCATCHVGELLGGKSFELMGRHANYFGERGGKLTDADRGRFNVTRREVDRHRFKVPTLRNVARTFPYFHDGSVNTLDAAVRSMAKYQSGGTLTDADVSAVVKFLESLTGEYEGKPL